MVFPYRRFCLSVINIKNATVSLEDTKALCYTIVSDISRKYDKLCKGDK